MNQITQYKYNEQGRMTNQIDANGHTTKFVYDIMGRLKEKTLPLGQKETYEYYPDGSLMAKVDANGTRTDYTYNSITKLLQPKSFSDGSRVDYTYWPDGSLKTATNNAGTTTFSYDIMGRVDRVVDPNNNVISYTYDRFGNRTQITGPHGTLKYTYDQLGRIETVTDQQGNVTRYAYDELGRQKKIACANGTETLYTYDTLSRLTSVVNRKTTGEIITSHKYTLDAAGHRIKIEEAGSTVEYGYDKLSRLTSEKRNGVVTLDDGYTYDPVGNRLTKSSLGGNAGYTYDENDRLKSDGKYTYGWDENGNLTSRAGADGSTTYKYDPENRLIEVSGPNGTVQFAYDAQGNRISRTTSSGTITFVVDPNMPYAQVLEESGPSGAKVYAYGNDMLNVQGPEGTRWFAYDGLGSTRALTDSTGTLTDAYTYEAFGAVVHRTGTSANEFQFTGEQYEAALDMYYLRARYYDASSVAFCSADPLSGQTPNPQSLNGYLYCQNDPVNRIDPSGQMSLIELNTSMATSTVLRMISQPSALMGRTVMWIAANQVLLAKIAFYAAIVSMVSTVYVTLEEAGIAPQTPPIGDYTIAQYVQFASSMIYLLAYAASSMVPASDAREAEVKIQERTTQLREQLGKSHGFGTTLSVGVAERADGTRVTLVSSNEGFLRSKVGLNPNEIFVNGTLHAEQNIVDYCRMNNLRLIGIGATRPVCDGCVQVIMPTNALIETPIKHPDQWYPFVSR